MNEVIQNVAVYALPVLLAITMHAAAKAYAAHYFGDSTAYQQGRVTLNPLKHIDPFGTILLPLVLALVPGAPMIGYSRPLPVMYGNMRNPKRDMAWVSLAGPVALLCMALLWNVLYVILQVSGAQEDFLLRVAQAGVITNLLFFALNLIPVPPLDGGYVVLSWLPHRLAYKYARVEPYGFFIVLALVAIKPLHFWDIWMRPVMLAGNFLIQLVLYPLTFLLG